MRTGGWILGMLGATAGLATAATWTCAERLAEPLQSSWLVAAACTGTGTYTTGGDPFGDGSQGVTNKNICDSGARFPRGILFGTTTTASGAPQFVAVWDDKARTIRLATAPQSGGPTASLVEVAAGTALDGFTIRMLAICQ